MGTVPPLFLGGTVELPSKVLMACLEVKKRRGSRVEGGRVIQLSYLEVFEERRGRGLEGFQPPLTPHF